MSSALLNSFHTKIKTIYWSVLVTFDSYHHNIWVHALIIRQSGDIEINLGPIPNACDSFSICHWNVNSLLHIII